MQHWTTPNWQSLSSTHKSLSFVRKGTHEQTKINETLGQIPEVCTSPQVHQHHCTSAPSCQPADGAFKALRDTQHTYMHIHTHVERENTTECVFTYIILML